MRIPNRFLATCTQLVVLLFTSAATATIIKVPQDQPTIQAGIDAAVSGDTVLVQAIDYRWGWEAHRYINWYAVDYLPPEMSFFHDHKFYLQQHSVDPDMDSQPGFYHYIDIDYYPEFFTGTLPNNWDDIVALYGYQTVTDNGIVPWVIDWWTDSLSALMSTGQWDDAWQVAAELGHYVGDSHQPLHLTLNYDGQLTGNNGIHSRYETHMITPHLSELPVPVGSGIYWENIIDSIFQYIDVIYPYVNLIMTADDLAGNQDPTYGTTYYSTLWTELDSITTDAIHRAILDLASVWRTAWVNAGKPIPPMISTTIINVPGGQPTIQEGIGAATDGDTVLVQPGTYVENINFHGKNIVVGSLFLTTGDTSYISRTVIDGNQTDAVVQIEGGEDSTTVLTGFTITNGSAGDGGGISCGNNSSPSLVNLVVTGNTATDAGGIDCWNNSNPRLVDVTISQNTASGGFGGGIRIDHSRPTLQNVTVTRNTATSYGGGIVCSNSNPTLINVTISGNSSEVGGGISCDAGSHPVLVNVIAWDDSPQEIYFIGWGMPSTVTIAYSDVQGGEEGIVTNDNGTVNWVVGNIDEDPLFVDVENGDFRLEEGSPCIDAGAAFLVMDNDTLVDLKPGEYVGSAPDMGAFESPYSVAVERQTMLPTQFGLSQPFPNPFNPATTIEFSIPRSGLVTLTVYDLLGKETETSLSQHMDAGQYKVQWNASDVPSGVYFIRMLHSSLSETSGDFSQVKKMMVLK